MLTITRASELEEWKNKLRLKVGHCAIILSDFTVRRPTKLRQLRTVRHPIQAGSRLNYAYAQN
jgi:hypothetical protein